MKRKSLMISSMDNLEHCPSVLSLLSLLRMCSYALSTGMAVNSDTTSKYLADELETVQKRVLKMLSPVMTYCEALEYYRLPTLFQRREDMCDKLFTSIIKDPMHKLHHLLPPKNETDYSFRTNRYFNMYVTRTNRFHNSFIPAMCRKFVGYILCLF